MLQRPGVRELLSDDVVPIRGGQADRSRRAQLSGPRAA
jgi:hypothetical protein